MKSKLLLTVAGLLTISEAYAVPTIYPTSPTYLSSIKNYTNSNLVADDADARVIYVMPPSSASSIVSGLHSITANVGFCKEMANLQGYSDQLSKRIIDITLQQSESKKEIDDLMVKLSAARLAMAESATVGRMNELTDLDDRISNIELQLVQLSDKLHDCSQNCEPLRAQIRDLRAEKFEVTKRRRELAASNSKDLREYEKKKAVVAGLKEDIEDRTESWNKLTTRLTSVQNDFLAIYSSFGKMEGARAGIQFKSTWDDNIASLRSENPNFDFKQIPTQNALITTNIAEINSIPTGGAILGFEIAGSRKDGALSLAAYPSNLSGNVRLSLLGTCPVLHPADFDINVPNGTDEMRYGMTVSYEYPSAFQLEATATYNMYKMYEKIVSSGSRGGFFKSKSWSSVEERNYFKDSFTVNWTEQDSGNSLTDDQRADIERDMRSDIFARLATVGLSGATSAGVLVAPPGLSKTGAVVISDSLMKTCPGNMYCVGAAMTMNVLQAIFGSSTTSASYKSIEDKNLTEKWSRNKVVYKPWISAYN